MIVIINWAVACRFNQKLETWSEESKQAQKQSQVQSDHQLDNFSGRSDARLVELLQKYFVI